MEWEGGGGGAGRGFLQRGEMEGEGGKGVRAEGGPGVLITRKLSHLLVHSRPPLPLLLPPQPPLPHPPLFFHHPTRPPPPSDSRRWAWEWGWGRVGGGGDNSRACEPPPPALSPPLLAVSSHCTLTHAHAHIRTRTHTQAHSIAHAHDRALFPHRKQQTDFAPPPTPKNQLGNCLITFLPFFSFLSALCISPHHSAPQETRAGWHARTHTGKHKFVE